MDMVAVASSNVASVGYDMESRVMRVAFCDGAIYDYADTSPELHAAFMASESKGKFVKRYLRDGVRSNEGAGFRSASARVADSQVLQTVAEDECCAKYLHKAIAADKTDGKRWTCPKCGCDWKADSIDGTILHWSPDPLIALLRV